YAAAGFLVGLPFLVGWLLGVVGGLLTDRLGAARAYAVAMVLLGAAYAAVGLVHSYVGIMALLVAAGALQPMTANGAQALLNQTVKPDHRGAAQNFQYWASNAGILLGLLVSAELLRAGHSATPFYLMGALRVVQALVVTGLFFRAMFGRTAPGGGRARPGPVAAVRAAMGDRALLYVSLATIMVMLLEAQLSSAVPLRLTATIGTRWYGPLMGIDAVMIVICQPLAMKYLPARRPYLWFGIGTVTTAVGLALGGIVNALVAWVVAMVMYSAGEVLWSTKLNDLLGEVPTPGHEGLYFSTVNSGVYLAVFAGTWIGGALLHVPTLLFGSLLVPAVAAVLFYRAGASHLRLRVAREQAQAGQVTQAAIPGMEAEAGGAPEEEAEGVAEVMTQGVGATYAPHPGGSLSDFGIPMPAERMVLLEHLKPDDWAAILAHTTRISFSAGEQLVERGAVERALYLVESGRLEVLVPGPGGQSRRLTVIEPGAVFGEQAFVDASPRSAAIRGVTGGTVYRLEWDGFEALARAEPDLARALMTDLARILSERLRRTTQYVTELASA
ncbi:MAG: MFS transporter, partial [Clostridia bacterium]